MHPKGPAAGTRNIVASAATGPGACCRRYHAALNIPVVAARYDVTQAYLGSRCQINASHLALKLSRSFCIPGLMTMDQMSG